MSDEASAIKASRTTLTNSSLSIIRESRSERSKIGRFASSDRLLPELLVLFSVIYSSCKSTLFKLFTVTVDFYCLQDNELDRLYTITKKRCAPADTFIFQASEPTKQPCQAQRGVIPLLIIIVSSAILSNRKSTSKHLYDPQALSSEEWAGSSQLHRAESTSFCTWQ